MDYAAMFDAAIDAGGGLGAVAAKLGDTPQTVANWRKRGVPANRALRFHQITGVSLKLIRPKDWREYWPDLDGEPAAVVAPESRVAPRVREAGAPAHGADDLTPLGMGVEQRAAPRGDAEPQRFVQPAAPADDAAGSVALATAALVGGKKLRPPAPRTEQRDADKAPAPAAVDEPRVERPREHSRHSPLSMGIDAREKPPRLDPDDRISICMPERRDC
jgi:hypothetical protein